jgi:hypothetical protein
MPNIPLTARQKLDIEKNVWIATARPDGRPHLVPVWFAWYAGKLYLCIERSSVKGRNLAANPQLSLALEDGSHPLIVEGRAEALQPPWPDGVVAIFKHKYDWDIVHDGQYDQLLEVTPERWLSW